MGIESLGFLELLLAIVSLPIQLTDFMVKSFLNLLIFDVLQLGPFLPITL